MKTYKSKLSNIVKATQITDEWFDGDHPNPLHLSTLTYDPIKRTVTDDLGNIGAVGDYVVVYSAGAIDVIPKAIFEGVYHEVSD
jgi:hypothetical protein